MTRRVKNQCSNPDIWRCVAPAARNAKFASICCVILLAAAGCERATVHGTVVDERGQLLPGVIVTVERTREQDLSDAMGAYSIQFRPRGTHILHYQKTGFTPAMLELSIDSPRAVQANAVEMWRVPPNPGVFILRNYRYESTTPVEIEPLSIYEAGNLYGTQRDPEYLTENSAPIIILHRMPTFDVRFARMEERPIALGDQKPPEDGPRAWVLAEPLAADLTLIDEPQGLLQRLSFDAPLEPGVYAVHWGALHGYTATEARIFFFRVPDPEAPAEEIEGETDETGETEEPEESPETPAPRDDEAVDDDGGF